MSESATELLKNIYLAYAGGEDYSINTPVSSQIHAFNMAVNEIKNYITFIRRDMVRIIITLNDDGLEFCMDNFEEA